MSECLFSRVPALSFVCELNDDFEHVVNSLWVVADGMTEVSFRRLPALLCLYC